MSRLQERAPSLRTRAGGAAGRCAFVETGRQRVNQVCQRFHNLHALSGLQVTESFQGEPRVFQLKRDPTLPGASASMPALVEPGPTLTSSPSPTPSGGLSMMRSLAVSPEEISTES